MNMLKKFCIVYATLCAFVMHSAGEIITITTPSNASTVDGASISITGTTSISMANVRLRINNTIIAFVTSSGGNWNYTYSNLQNNAYILSAEIIDNSFAPLASDTISFAVSNNPFIAVQFPKADSTIGTLLPALIVGASSLASGNVQLTVDDEIFGTFPTDTNGNWQANFPSLENNQHTLVAELLNPGVVATDTITFTSSNPLTHHLNASNFTVIQGIIPTSGSGNGNGFAYSITGTTATVTFTKPFSITPVVIATGFDTGGSSTIALSSVSTTVAVIEFSAGTDQIHFQASVIS